MRNTNRKRIIIGLAAVILAAAGIGGIIAWKTNGRTPSGNGAAETTVLQDEGMLENGRIRIADVSRNADAGTVDVNVVWTPNLTKATAFDEVLTIRASRGTTYLDRQADDGTSVCTPNRECELTFTFTDVDSHDPVHIIIRDTFKPSTVSVEADRK